MLANDHFAREVNYVSPSTEHRSEYIQDDDDDESNNNIQSDLVRAALGLPYFHACDGFEFNYKFMDKIRKETDKAIHDLIRNEKQTTSIQWRARAKSAETTKTRNLKKL